MENNRIQGHGRAIMIRPCLFALGCFALFGSGQSYADAFLIPSVTLAVVHDDNIFVTADTQDEDTIVRLTPELQFVFESPTLNIDSAYRRDLESYAEHSELNSSSMRQSANFDADFQASNAVLLSFEAAYTESQLPSDLNINSGTGPGLGLGLGAGRLKGDRSTVTPGLEYRFSETATGLLEYTWITENVDSGIDSDINQINAGFEHALNSRNRLIYGYTYSKYEFSIGPSQDVHTPEIGIDHDFSANTNIIVQGGPRIEEDNVDVSVSLILNHLYGAGQMTLRYDRDVTTLIGEVGVVQIETIGATLVHRVGNSVELSLAPSVGRVTRPDTTVQDADVYRLDLETRYVVNDEITLFAAYGYSYQESGFLNFSPAEIPRNLFTLGITLRLPNSYTAATGDR